MSPWRHTWPAVTAVPGSCPEGTTVALLLSSGWMGGGGGQHSLDLKDVTVCG